MGPHKCPKCGRYDPDLPLMSQCPNCREWFPDAVDPAVVDITFKAVRPGAHEIRAPYYVPPAKLMLSVHEPADQPVPIVNYVTYRKHRINTPVGPRVLFIRAEDMPILEGILSLTNQHLELIERRAANHARSEVGDWMWRWAAAQPIQVRSIIENLAWYIKHGRLDQIPHEEEPSLSDCGSIENRDFGYPETEAR